MTREFRRVDANLTSLHEIREQHDLLDEEIKAANHDFMYPPLNEERREYIRQGLETLDRRQLHVLMTVLTGIGYVDIEEILFYANEISDEIDPPLEQFDEDEMTQLIDQLIDFGLIIYGIPEFYTEKYFFTPDEYGIPHDDYHSATLLYEEPCYYCNPEVRSAIEDV